MSCSPIIDKCSSSYFIFLLNTSPSIWIASASTIIDKCTANPDSTTWGLRGSSIFSQEIFTPTYFLASNTISNPQTKRDSIQNRQKVLLVYIIIHRNACRTTSTESLAYSRVDLSYNTNNELLRQHNKRLTIIWSLQAHTETGNRKLTQLGI